MLCCVESSAPRPRYGRTQALPTYRLCDANQGLIGFIGACAIVAGRMGFKLDYDKMLLLDAENLAEGGVLRAYQSVLNVLTQHGVEPRQVEEFVDNNKPSYSVRSGDQEYLIYAPALP